MYYTFFETGDKQFFSDLMQVFCTTYIFNVVDLYNAVKQEKSHKINIQDLEKHMDEERRKKLNFFNCSQHLMAKTCENLACIAGHTAVLAKDQHDVMENLMKNTKNSYGKLNYSGEKTKVWKEIQRIFQNYKMFEFFELKKLNFEADDPDKYLDNYIEETNKIEPAEGYAYVRTTANSSHFPNFNDGTKLPKEKVVPCDILQKA